MTTIGVIGLGVMGSALVRRLTATGFGVVGYNRTRAKAEALGPLGMRIAGSPRELAQSVDVVFSIVTADAALLAVADGPDGLLAGLRPGQTFLDLTTLSPATSRALAERVALTGAVMLDAPVSGSVSMIEDGTFSFMVGGPADAFERIRPLLGQLAASAIRVGPNGYGAHMKIATNLSLGVQTVAFAESLLLATRGGIEPEIALSVLLSSAAASPMLRYRGPFMVHPTSDVLFDAAMMQKDLGLALDAGRRLAVPLPTTAVTNELLNATRGLGYGDEDFSSVYRVLERLAGPADEQSG